MICNFRLRTGSARIAAQGSLDRSKGKSPAAAKRGLVLPESEGKRPGCAANPSVTRRRIVRLSQGLGSRRGGFAARRQAARPLEPAAGALQCAHKFFGRNLEGFLRKGIDKDGVLCYSIQADICGCAQRCGCSSMVESQPSKLVAWVRFPSPAPYVPVARVNAGCFVYSWRRKIGEAAASLKRA